MTVFQKIINREIPSKIVYEDNLSLVFHDINPQAPIHLLVIPKKPIPSIAAMEEGDDLIIGHLMKVAKKVASELGLDQDGYRLVTNIGNHGGQTVPHLHFHLLGGRPMKWPPG
jgi:histidine triad (HIT) family protein